MNYLFKKIGYAKRKEGFSIKHIEENDCRFWEMESKVYFGGSLPIKLDLGDILIQEVSSSKDRQNHAVVGIFKVVSKMKSVAVGPHVCDEEKGKWTSYVEVLNLTPKFGKEAKVRLENDKTLLLDLEVEWKRLGEKRLPYYGAGWAYIPQDKIKEIIEKITSIEQGL